MSEKNLRLDLDDADDIGFVHAVRPVVEGVIEVVGPSEIYLVKIDSWFGEKWLSFSHKMLGALGVHQRDLRVPPFVPSRVVSETFLRSTGAGIGYEGATAPLTLHIEQTSSENAARKVSALCPEAALFWWSGQTRANARGSLMAYLPTPEGHHGWYVELKNDGGWIPCITRCISASEVAAFAAARAC